MESFYIRHDESAKSGQSTRPKQSDSLFESKTRRRLLRVLLDGAILDGSNDFDQDRILQELLGSPLIKVWNYDFIVDHHQNESKSEFTDVFANVSVREVTGRLGAFEFPGLNFSYSYSETDHGSKSKTTGLFQIDPPEVTFARFGNEMPSQEQIMSLKSVQALDETARHIGADIVLTRRHLEFELPLTKLGIHRLASPESVIATITHYLRSQGEFIVNVSPRKTTTGDNFFRQALYAYCPNIAHWEAKATRATEFSTAVPSDHILLLSSAFARFERALRRLDDLILIIGRPQTLTTVDDALDTVDHILVSLCGGVDALARSLGLALDPKPSRAKLHLANWVTANMHDPYGHSPEFEKLQSLLPSLKFVFDMRNSIHEIALMPAFENLEEDTRTLGRIQLIVPPSYRDNWEKLGEFESEMWRLHIADNIVQVDLLHFALKAIESVLNYVDSLCELLSFEQVGDSNGILYENIRSVFSDEQLEVPTFIAKTGHLKSPLLDGSYDPRSKRHLETDDHSVLSQMLFEMARRAGLLGTDRFAFMDPDAVITTHYDSRNGD